VYSEIRKVKIKDVLVGTLSIFLAAALSYYCHQLGHIISSDAFCNFDISQYFNRNTPIQGCVIFSNCSLSIIAGPLATILLAILSLWAFVKYPYNHFFGALALINSSARVGYSFILFIQMLLLRYHPTVNYDERLIINLIHFPDMASALVLIFFYVLFNAVLVIIAVRTLAWTGIWKLIFVVIAILSQFLLIPIFAVRLSTIVNFIY
jgi:hypothetical protein